MIFSIKDFFHGNRIAWFKKKVLEILNKNGVTLKQKKMPMQLLFCLYFPGHQGSGLAMVSSGGQLLAMMNLGW